MQRMKIIPAGMEGDNDEDFDFDDSVFKTSRNMKITIIPDITIKAGLNNENFDATLPEDIVSWFEKYKIMWNLYKKTPAMVNTLQTLYITNENPLLLALKLFANCPDCNNVKNKSLALLIMEEISNLRKEKPEIIEQCTDEMKMVSFNFVKIQGLPCLYKPVVHAYDLPASKNLFEPKIIELIKMQYYKDAAHWAIFLGLTERFGIYDIVFPLILQDKISVAEEYLDVAKHLQRPAIILLDSLLDKNVSVVNNCDKYIEKYKYTDVKMEKLHHKPLTKLVVRLMRKYNLPADVTPNVNRSKSLGFVQYLIFKRYVEKSLNNESWRELLRDAITKEDREIHLELVSSIFLNNDSEEAAYWARQLDLPIEKLPPPIQDLLDSNRPATSKTYECPNENTKLQTCELKYEKHKFYDPSLEHCSIVMVDTSEKFSTMLQSLKNVNLIAFDSEWKPSFHKHSAVSLIQIAIPHNIFLIDVLSNFDSELWYSLGRGIFNNPEVLKIGFSLHHDLAMFQKALPGFATSTATPIAFLDLQDLWKKLQNIPDFNFPYQASSSGETLSVLVEICLGKKLDKSNQFSNWGKRPLRKDQLKYAALDAYCLLEIYNVLTEKLKRHSYDVDTFIESLISEVNSKKSRKKGKPQNSKPSVQIEYLVDGPNLEPVRAHEVKFVCDTMLEGLCKALRKFGIDCISISNHDFKDMCVKIAIKEKRFLLTKGSMFSKFSQYLRPGYCYKVTNDKIDLQVSEVLAYYNIVVSEDNIFSRCQNCNSNEFLIARASDMKWIYFGQSSNVQDDKSKMKHIRRTSVLRNITQKSLITKATSRGVPIQITDLPTTVMDTVDIFFICEGCGKIYWDGSHLDRVITGKFKDTIIKN